MVLVLMAIFIVVAVTLGSSSEGEGASKSESILPDLVPIAELEEASPAEVHVAYAPDVPPPTLRSDQRFYEIKLEVLENVCTIDSAQGLSIDMWGYRVEGDEEVSCGTPGPILRGRVGDLVRITLTNLPDNVHPHNIDFHAVTGHHGGAADLTVAPGETASIDVRLLYPGAFMYHCAFGDVPVHIMHGMYGMFIVDPEEPLPEVEHEWALVQSEWYTTEPDAAGLTDIDRESLLDEEPTHVVFNGTVGALTGDNALSMEVGDRARIYFVNEGLNLDSNFHPIGSHWDLVYPEGATHPSNRVIRGSQTTLVPAGGGTVVELVGLAPSTILLVDHALSRTFYKGALGMINVEGDENPEIFSVSSPATETGATPGQQGGHGAEPAQPASGEVHEVSMLPGSSTVQPMDDPSEFADDEDPADYSTNVLTIKAGDTVRFTNTDAGMIHTATAVDGSFDTGFLSEGESAEVTFDTPGEYEYYCLPHPWMRAKIIVEPG
jgi:nitrite reductase (NO-forming)